MTFSLLSADEHRQQSRVSEALAAADETIKAQGKLQRQLNNGAGDRLRAALIGAVQSPQD